MEDSILEDKIVASIKRRGMGVSFVELERDFPEEFGEPHEYAMVMPGYENIILWAPMSQKMADALASCIKNGRIDVQPTTPLVYAADGKALNLPLAKGKRQYKSERWLPVVFGSAKKTK